MAGELSKLFICPKCKGGLSAKEDHVECSSCASAYPRKGSALDFMTLIEDKAKHWDAEAFDKAYSEADTGFEDGMQHALLAGIPRFAEVYRQESKGKLIKDFLAENKPSRVLDLGCGCGWFCFELQELLPETEYYGIDVSAFRVNIFKDEIEKRNSGDKMDAAVANGESLPFPDNSFGAVVMREVLEHVQEPGKTFAEIMRILEPGGFLMISTPTRIMTDFWETAAIIPTFLKRLLKNESLKKAGETVYDEPLSCAHINKIISEVGFEIERWDRVIFLPHESYLQFIPKPLLRLMIFFAKIIKKLRFLNILGLHHVIFLKKK
jgi:ubiquinone/menaquinone biosynthesis C-methylase UbiE